MMERLNRRHWTLTETAALLLMGVYLFVLNLPGVVTVREAGLFLAVALAAYLMYRNGRLEWPPMKIALAAWVVICLASVFVSADPGLSISEIKKDVVYPVLAFWLFYVMTRGRREFTFLSAFVVVAALLTVLVSLYLYAVQGVRFMTLIPEGRLYGERAYFGFFMLASVCVALAVIMSGRVKTAIGALSVALIPLGLAGVYFARLRGGYLAAAVSVCLLLVYTNFVGRSARRKAVTVALIVLIALPVPWFLARINRPELTLSPVVISSAIESIKKEERWAIWREAVDNIAERPVLGRGFGDKEMYIPGFRVENIYPHNLLLSYGMMAGVAGAAVVLVLFVRLFMLLGSAITGSGATGASVLGAPLAGILLVVVFVTINMTEDIMTRQTGQFFWALMGMTLGSIRGDGGGDAAGPGPSSG